MELISPVLHSWPLVLYLKAAVKEEKRQAREAKKELKGLYKSEAQKAQKVAAVTGPSSIRLM